MGRERWQDDWERTGRVGKITRKDWCEKGGTGRGREGWQDDWEALVKEGRNWEGLVK